MILTLRIAFDRRQAVHVDQCVAVHTHKLCRKFLFKCAQRVFDQIAAGSMPHRGVFLIGSEEIDLRHWNQAQLLAQARCDMGARRTRRIAGGDARQLCGCQTHSTLQRSAQLFSAYGFEQVAYRLRLKRFDGIGIVGGGEYHRRRFGQYRHVPCGLKSVHARHTHIEQHHIGVKLACEPHRLLAVAGLTDDLDIAEFTQQPLQPLSSGRFIIDDQNTLGHSDEMRVTSSTYGKRKRTMYSSPKRWASTDERPG